ADQLAGLIGGAGVTWVILVIGAAGGRGDVAIMVHDARGANRVLDLAIEDNRRTRRVKAFDIDDPRPNRALDVEGQPERPGIAVVDGGLDRGIDDVDPVDLQR